MEENETQEEKSTPQLFVGDSSERVLIQLESSMLRGFISGENYRILSERGTLKDFIEFYQLDGETTTHQIFLNSRHVRLIRLV